MKKEVRSKLFALTVVATCLFNARAATAQVAVADTKEVMPTSTTRVKPGTVRVQLVRDAAMSAAMRAALAKQTEYINRLLDINGRLLDDAFDFASIMLSDSVVPPVVRKIENVTEQSGDVLQYSAMQFQITRQATFATRPPTWRTYLPIPVWADLGSTHPSLLPANAEETAAAQMGLRQGWQAGTEQANAMLFKGLNRLDNDWTGMLVYHALLKAKMVTAPIVNRQDTAVSGGTDSMTVDQSTYRIEAKPVFNPNISSWLALLNTTGTAGLNASTLSTTASESNRATLAVPSLADMMRSWTK